MARSRARKAETADATNPEAELSFNPAEFDPEMQQQAGEIVHGVAESTRIPGDGERSHASGHIVNPSSKRREGHAAAVRRTHDLPDKLTVIAGDLKVQMIDRGSNEAGIGIKVVFPNGRKPTPEELSIIRDHMKGENGRPGLNWDRHAGMWHAEIVRPGEHPNEVPASRPVAVRLSVESRVQKLAEALREHQADPAGFAEQVRQRREQGSERVPF